MNRNADVQWQLPGMLTVLAIIALIGLYWQTAAFMVQIWWTSETFAHGFIVVPVSIFLIWRKRRELAVIQPRPVAYALFVLAMLGFGWLLASLANVEVVKQFALVSSCIVLVWGMLGWKVTRTILFPLAFLLFSVPVGKALVPQLMDFTALFTVAALKLTGIPVFAEGTFFSIPGSSWSVVEGCSGIRYLIASITLGCLYAYLTYRSPLRRLLFVLASIVFPVLANGMRAYIIVMIAHLSDMRLGLRIDHYIYGWLFFGLVLFLMFWIGLYWREDTADIPAKQDKPVVDVKQQTLSWPGWVTMCLLSVLVLAIWPAWGAWIDARSDLTGEVRLMRPAATAGWSPDPELLADWKPHYVGADAEIHQTYTNGERRVGVYLPFYKSQRQDAELINAQNYLIKQKHEVWQQIGQDGRLLAAGGIDTDVIHTRLRSAQQNLLVYHWNWFDGIYSTNPYLAELVEAVYRLTGKQFPAAAIIVYTEYSQDTTDAETALHLFIEEMLPSIEQSLMTAAGQDGRSGPDVP